MTPECIAYPYTYYSETVAFTLDTYTHVVPGLQEAAAKAFDQALKINFMERTAK